MNNMPSDEVMHTMIKVCNGLIRRQNSFLSNALEGHDLRLPLVQYVRTIHRIPGTSQDFLAEFHSVDKSWVARIARELESLGYLLREEDENDRRSYRLYLTESGEALFWELEGFLHEWESIVSKEIATEDVQKITDIVRKMNENADEYFGK